MRVAQMTKADIVIGMHMAASLDTNVVELTQDAGLEMKCIGRIAARRIDHEAVLHYSNLTSPRGVFNKP